MAGKLFILSLILLVIGCSEAADPEAATDRQQAEVRQIDFWNGNRSQARQLYERAVLEAVLAATKDDMGAWEIVETRDEYPGDAEAGVFSEKGHDLFVTIAGNQNFGEDDVIVVPYLLTRNLLGYRVPIIREEDAGVFASIELEEELQALNHGIPETWSDAVIFRHNGYSVVEEGNFDDIFERLSAGRFEYSAYGVNEVQGVFENRASKQPGLTIDYNLLIFYPFPLVFYVNPGRTELARRIETGMQRIIASGRLDEVFDAHYGDIVEQLRLKERTLFLLENPLLPHQFSGLEPDLDGL
jgi:hypothetical protein